MKKLIPFVCAGLLAGALAGCDKDNGDGGNNPPPPPGGKRIVAMSLVAANGVIEENYTFGYDAEGRMSSMPPLAFTYSSDGFGAAGTFTDPDYPEDSFRIEYAYTLSDGLARSLVCTETDGDYTDSFRQDYTYGGGRLSKVVWSDADYGESYSFTWTDGSISGIEIAETAVGEEDYITDRILVTPGTTPNNMNLDLFGIIFIEFNGGIIDFAMLNDFAGERTAMLPAAFTDTRDRQIFAEFSYTLDDEGYITDIHMRWDGSRTRLHFTYR